MEPSLVNILSIGYSIIFAIPVIARASIKSKILPIIPQATRNKIAPPKLSGSTQFQATIPEPNQEAIDPKINSTERKPLASDLFIILYF